MKTTEIVSVLLPSWNNPEYLIPCLNSLLLHIVGENLFKVYVIDNGDKIKVRDYLPPELLNRIVLIEAGKNLGWEGGLNLGLTQVPKDVEFVMFLNDDTYIPFASRFWILKMLQWFKYPTVGAVGPTTNVVMAGQNIFNAACVSSTSTELLIGFCILLRKSALEKVGGVDKMLPGGDDFDLSIRLVDGGYKLIIDRSVFIFHHGFKSGERLRGNANVGGGWNSFEMYQDVNHALIEKHGFARWQRLMLSLNRVDEIPNNFVEDGEGNVIRKILGNKGKVYELGCGGQLTVPEAIGVDLVPFGELIPTINVKSVAKIVADVSQPLPFIDADYLIARHILEHMDDPIETLENWYHALKYNGTLIVAVPDEDLSMTIPMNVQHKHAYNKKFLKRLFKIVGFKEVFSKDSGNGVSFIVIGVKR